MEQKRNAVGANLNHFGANLRAGCSQGAHKVLSRGALKRCSQGAFKVLSRGALKVLSRCFQGAFKRCSQEVGGARSSEVEGVARLFRANHRRLSGSPGPPMKLRAGSQGTGKPSRKWGGSEALPTPPGLCAWAGFPVPSRERKAAQFLGSSHPDRSPVSNRTIPGMASEHRKQLRAGAAARSDVEMSASASQSHTRPRRLRL